jgi:hypothetical protein
MQSIFEQEEQQKWLVFDAAELYHACGGDGEEGVSADTVLDYMQNTGIRVLSQSHRYRIGSYAYADPFSDGITPIKAALAVGRPCVLALLLPSDFLSGDCGEGAQVTSGYHQVLVTGYDDSRLKFLNSYGNSYGDNGFGSLPISFLQRPEQEGFVYAFTAIDAIDDQANLPPTELKLPQRLLDVPEQFRRKKQRRS